jgi:oxygen-independent coproporphyrinogen-3 oxidase
VNPELAIYIHIPFCHSLCYYCGCNKIVTRNHDKIHKYVQYLITEIIIRAELFKNHRVIQIHFDGGTPSMLEPDELKDILAIIGESYNVVENPEVSMEIDPREVEQRYIRALPQWS